MADTGSNSVTPLEGKTTIDERMFFEPERLSYQSAARIAEKIAGEVRDNYPLDFGDKTVVIAGTQLLADFANLRSVYLILESLQKDYVAVSAPLTSTISKQPLAESKASDGGDKSNKKAEKAVPFAAETAILDTALGLVSLFRQDVEYHGIKTVIDALAFEIALAAKVKGERARGAKKVFVPDLMVVPQTGKESSLRQHLQTVQDLKAEAWKAAGPRISELVSMEARLDEAARSNDQELLNQLARETSDFRRDMQPLIEALGRADQRLADLQNKLSQSSSPDGLTLLARLLRAEAIQAMQPLYLHAAVVSSGGHHRISRNLFRMLFLGDGLSFAGGATVRWALLENDGSVTKGGILVIRRSTLFQFLADEVSQNY